MRIPALSGLDLFYLTPSSLICGDLISNTIFGYASRLRGTAAVGEHPTSRDPLKQASTATALLELLPHTVDLADFSKLSVPFLSSVSARMRHFPG